MNMLKANKDYEAWVTQYTKLIKADLDLKHREMAAAIFPFLRATFFRWVQVWPSACKEAADAPVLLSVGDLHIENFGTWRDMEGRLVWGVNDFDETCHLPYTNDLVRLATSAYLAIEASTLRLKPADATDAILAGYTDTLQAGGRPYVLAHDHAWLRSIAVGVLRDPVRYWDKMAHLPDAPEPVSETAIAALEHALPRPGLPYTLKARVAGMGSLGHPRYVAIAQWEGGMIAREAKALVPSGAVWARQEDNTAEIYYQAIIDHAVRCRDPFISLQGKWIVRRLASDCSRIELSSLPEERDEAKLLHAMGSETANIHLGNKGVIQAVRDDLKKRPKNWLKDAVAAAMKVLREDWNEWRTGRASA
jgi:hypothetical protein